MLIPFGILSAAGAGVGVAGDYELIETSILTSSASSVTFSNLGTYSSTYKHLQLRAVARHNAGAGGGSSLMIFNGDTAANYSRHNLTGDGSTVFSQAQVSSSWIEIPAIGSAGNAANIFGGHVIDILDPYSTTKNKTIRALAGKMSSDGGNNISLISGNWRSTASVTSMTFTPNAGSLIAGSRFSLYGIKG
jgi:hypothetical protein